MEIGELRRNHSYLNMCLAWLRMANFELPLAVSALQEAKALDFTSLVIIHAFTTVSHLPRVGNNKRVADQAGPGLRHLFIQWPLESEAC